MNTPATLADALAREAGPPHVAMADAPIIDTAEWWLSKGFEPPIEARPACAQSGPWYCTETQRLRARLPSTGYVMACNPKLPCPEPFPTLWPAPGAAVWVYPDNWRPATVYAGAGWLIYGGGGGGGGSSSSSDTETVERTFYSLERYTETHHHYHDTPGETPETPAPVPLMASLWAMLAGLAGFGMLRRTR